RDADHRREDPRRAGEARQPRRAEGPHRPDGPHERQGRSEARRAPAHGVHRGARAQAERDLMLRLPRFRYVSPPTLEEAIRLRTEHADSSMYVAGGTDVYPKMKRRQFQPEVVISLGRVVSDGFADGTGTSFAEQGPLPPGLRIGANASLTAVSEHPKVREGYAALAQAASLISTPQLRNMGTIGGNICLDT